MGILFCGILIEIGAVLIRVVFVGDNVKICANSDIDKDVPSNVLIAGNSAIVIK